ncbi:MAG: TspO/MBR family protein [Pseudomonadota bacterium]
MSWGDYGMLFVFIALCTVAASSGAMFKPDAWYQALKKPWWNPPNWVFPVVWTPLYAMIAVAGWFVWLEAGFAGAALPLTFYVLQLILNALWSALFFGAKRIDWALTEVGLLWLAIATCVVTFWPISQAAALLMLPYLLWVTIAAYLNYTVLKLNPSAAQAA